MAKYLIRKEPNFGFVQIAKEENGVYYYWNNRIKKWRANDGTAFGIFAGFEDGLHFPVSEEEVKKVVAEYE